MAEIIVFPTDENELRTLIQKLSREINQAPKNSQLRELREKYYRLLGRISNV